MNEKILELCNRCMKHNATINITIYPYKSTVFIDLQGERLRTTRKVIHINVFHLRDALPIPISKSTTLIF